MASDDGAALDFYCAAWLVNALLRGRWRPTSDVMMLVLELLVALLLIGLNGLFALSELAIVSTRKTRLRALAEAGRSGAAQALALAEDPGRFLSTVQIGITLIGLLAGVFSGAALSARLTGVFLDSGLSNTVAEPAAYLIVIGIITYLSVIVGELVPKQLALRNPEAIACAVARPMALISRAAAPVIWILDSSTRLVFALFGASESSDAAVTEQDIKTLVAEAETAGVIATDERAMISGVLRLGDRSVRGVMTPRTEVDWIDLNDAEAEIRKQLSDTPRSRIPVADRDPDNMLGVLQSRDLVGAVLREEPFDLRALVRSAPIVPDTVDALDVLTILRDADVPMALVYDEYGHFEGIVTPADILDAIAGAFRSDQTAESDSVRRKDGSWLLAGSMPADEMADHLGITLPADRSYETVAGFVIDGMHRLPNVAETVDAHGWRFEVVDLDGRRIDKVLATRVAQDA